MDTELIRALVECNQLSRNTHFPVRFADSGLIIRQIMRAIMFSSVNVQFYHFTLKRTNVKP